MAASNPSKLKKMQEMLWVEMAKYQCRTTGCGSVYTFGCSASRPHSRSEDIFTYSGETVTGIPHGGAPNLLNTSYTITAEVEIPQGGAEGIINTNGGRFGGYALYLMRNKPVFTWNLFNLKRVRWEGKDSFSPGKHSIEFDFKYDGLGSATLALNNISGIGRGGVGVLRVDGKVVATEKMEHAVPLILQWDDTFDIGEDTGTSVDDRNYQVPFKFTGKIAKLAIAVDEPKLTPEDEKRLMEAAESTADRR